MWTSTCSPKFMTVWTVHIASARVTKHYLVFQTPVPGHIWAVTLYISLFVFFMLDFISSCCSEVANISPNATSSSWPSVLVWMERRVCVHQWRPRKECLAFTGMFLLWLYYYCSDIFPPVVLSLFSVWLRSFNLTHIHKHTCIDINILALTQTHTLGDGVLCVCVCWDIHTHGAEMLFKW